MNNEVSSSPPSSPPVPERPYRELTVISVILGILIGSLMNAAFVYIALKLGFSLGGSTVAAIIGFGILKVSVDRASIIENNINQTIASGVNNASAGVVFTLPALFLMGADFSPWSAMLSAIAGTFLGIVIIIPLRKQMIEFERLRFPSGIAVASLLKSPGAGAQQAKLLGFGFALATLIHVSSELTGISEIDIGGILSIPSYFPIILGISFASIGAGMLAGGGGLPFVAGGVLAWWVISPLVSQLGWLPSADSLGLNADDTRVFSIQGQALYQAMLRPLGIGTLIGGAIAGVIASLPALKGALKSLSNAAQAGASGSSDELDANSLAIAAVSAFGLLFSAAVIASSQMSILECALIAVVGFLWLILAGLVVAQATGVTDISPLSGMSLIGVTLMYFLSGGDTVVAVILGVAVCVGIGQCADMMSDLKAGHLIGASPRKQQLAQLAFSWVGVPVAVGVLYLLWTPDGGGFGPGAASGLSAPQGDALQGILKGLASGDAPLDKYFVGAIIGLSLGVFPISGLGVLVGLAMYLPFSVTLTYAVGSMISIGLEKSKGRSWMGSNVVPFAAGMIIGEALTSITAVLIRLATGAT
jgi:putative OPT family oligopeptide transporter